MLILLTNYFNQPVHPNQMNFVLDTHTYSFSYAIKWINSIRESFGIIFSNKLLLSFYKMIYEMHTIDSPNENNCILDTIVHFRISMPSCPIKLITNKKTIKLIFDAMHINKAIINFLFLSIIIEVLCINAQWVEYVCKLVCYLLLTFWITRFHLREREIDKSKIQVLNWTQSIVMAIFCFLCFLIWRSMNSIRCKAAT